MSLVWATVDGVPLPNTEMCALDSPILLQHVELLYIPRAAPNRTWLNYSRLCAERGDGGALPVRVHVDGADVVLRRGFRHDCFHHFGLDASQILASPGKSMIKC